MAGPSLLQLSSLLTAAPQGDPLAKAALPFARDQFISPPPIASDMGGIAEGMRADRPQFSLPGSTPQLDSPELKAGVMNTGSPAGPGTQISGGNTFTPEKSGFWDDPKHRQVLQGGLAGLLGMGVGKLTGLGGGNVAAAAIQPSLKDIYTRKQMDLEREGRAMEEAYKQAQELPSEVANDPKFQELYQAQQQLIKDIGEGKANSKSLSNFLTIKAKYSKDLEDAGIERKINDEIMIKDRLDQALQERDAQKSLRLKQILEDPMASEMEKQTAQAQLFMIEKDKREFELRQRELEETRKARTEAQLRDDQYRQDALGVQRENLALRKQYYDQQGKYQQAQIGQRDRLAAAANYQRRWNDEANREARIANDPAMTQETMLMRHGDEIKQMAGIGDPDGKGNIQIGGEIVPLSGILLNDEWDANGTPNRKGWLHILQLGHDSIMKTPTELGASRLSGAYGVTPQEDF